MNTDKRFIRIEIMANGRHCDNNCGFMSHDAKRCSLFGELTWDCKKEINGNTRPAACRKAACK